MDWDEVPPCPSTSGMCGYEEKVGKPTEFQTKIRSLDGLDHSLDVEDGFWNLFTG